MIINNINNSLNNEKDIDKLGAELFLIFLYLTN